METTFNQPRSLGPNKQTDNCPTFSNLTAAIHFVRQFDLGKGHGLFHPVRPEVGRVRVDVDAVWNSGFRFAPGDPVPVDVFPSVAVHLDEVQQERVHATGGKAGHRAPEHRKHPSENTHSNSQTRWTMRHI